MHSFSLNVLVVRSRILLLVRVLIFIRMRIRCHLAWRRTQFFPAESAHRVRTWCGGHSVKVFSRTGGVPCTYSEFDMRSLGRASVYAARCSASRGSSQFPEIRCSRSEESWMRRKLGRNKWKHRHPSSTGCSRVDSVNDS
jgi:hypothetical protein